MLRFFYWGIYNLAHLAAVIEQRCGLGHMLARQYFPDHDEVVPFGVLAARAALKRSQGAVNQGHAMGVGLPAHIGKAIYATLRKLQGQIFLGTAQNVDSVMAALREC